MSAALLPVPLVYVPIRVHILAVTVSLSLLPVPLVNSSIRVQHGAFAMTLTILVLPLISKEKMKAVCYIRQFASDRKQRFIVV